MEGDLPLCLCLSALCILLTRADIHAQGPPLGPYEQGPVQSYYRKDPCAVSNQPLSPDGTVTTPKENFGKPYYPCIYNFTELEGEFFLSNGTYFPCLEPRALPVLRVGAPLPEGVRIRKGVHQSIAVKFAAEGQSIPLVAALLTEGLILVTNTSTPYDVARNLGFHRALQKKIDMRRRDSTPYSHSQLHLAKALYHSLTTIVDSAERHMLAINRRQARPKTLGPFIVADLQTFSTPSTRGLESVQDLHPDFVAAEQTFGLGGTRFEFENPRITTEKIAELVKSSDVPTVELGSLGGSPQESSRSTLATFGRVVELARVAQRELSLVLSSETSEINANSAFNFTYTPPLSSAYCNRPIEIDPRGHVYGGNMIQSVGMGMVRQRE